MTSPGLPPGVEGLSRPGFSLDLGKCVGCGACVLACRIENQLPSDVSWRRILQVNQPRIRGGPTYHLSVACHHCENPPCTKVCPVQATQSDDEGLVAQVYPRCIGCRYCTTACPYTVREFNWKTPVWPEPMATGLNPDVSIRPKGVVEKCSFCHHRLQLAEDRARLEDRELADGDYLPACVESCPAGAMAFGDLENPHSEVAILEGSPRAFRLLEELGTRPKVIYLSKGEWGGAD